MSLKNVRIAPKIAAIVVVLSLVGLGGSLFLAHMMSQIDTRYTELLDLQSVASIRLSQTSARIVELDLSAYHALTYPGASLEAKAAAEAYKEALVLAKTYLDEAAKLLPGVAEISTVGREIDDIDKLGRRAIEAGLRDDDRAAKAALVQIDPLVRDLGRRLKAIIEAQRNKQQVESDLMTVNVDRAYYITIAAGIAVALAGIGLSLLICLRGITGPLGRLQRRMGDLAEGRLDVEVENQDRGDEIGGMARAVQVFKDNALRAQVMEREADEVRRAAEEERARNEAVQARLSQELATVVASLAQGLTRLSSGDLTYRLSDVFAENYETLRVDFNAAIGQLQDTMKVVAGNTAGIHSGSGEISQAADNLSKRTEQQAASLEETAAALDEITATVKRKIGRAHV